MNWQRLVGASALALCASGCATGMRRDLTNVGPRSPARAGDTAPRQVQESVKPDQPDLFLSVAGRPDRPGLARYFPGLSRPEAGKSPAPGSEKSAPTEVTLVASAEPGPSAPVASPSPPGRSGWFGHRKPRGPQTYVTDARSAVSPRGAAVPEILPVALQLPRPTTDRAVTTTSREVPAADEGPQAAPIDPDSSSAEAKRPPATEPQLAIPPIDPPTAAIRPAEPEPAADAKPEAPAQPEADRPEPEARPEAAPDSKAEVPPDPKPAAEPSAPAAVDAAPEREARGRRRLPTTPSASYVEAKGSTQPAEPAARVPGPAAVAAKPTAPPAESRADREVSGTAADPGNSLGLPKAMLPASYTSHQSVAVRGNLQANQPPPVLASPQVEASPQAPAATVVEAKTWRRPGLRRLIRRTWKLGEFANPPTAAPR